MLNVLNTVKFKNKCFFNSENCSSSCKFSQAFVQGASMTVSSSPVFRFALWEDPSVVLGPGREDSAEGHVGDWEALLFTQTVSWL